MTVFGKKFSFTELSIAPDTSKHDLSVFVKIGSVAVNRAIRQVAGELQNSS